MSNTNQSKKSSSVRSLRLTALAMLFLLGALSLPSSVRAQPEIETQETTPLSYKELSQAIRNNEREINRLYSSMPIGFQERQKQYMEQIEKLTAANVRLNGELYNAALTSFTKNPSENLEAARILYRELKEKLNPASPSKMFDPAGAQKLGFTLLGSGLEVGQWPEGIGYPNLLYLTFRASFAIEDFENADQLLTQIEDLNIGIKSEIRDQVESAKKRWEREMLIRRFETNTPDNPKVKLETTEGVIVVELFENHAPQTIGNFISLVEKNFYNDMNFFQVEPGEYARIGCSKNDGTSDAGYRIANELDREQLRDNFAGTLAMVTREDGTAGSQFIINHQPNSKIDGVYTVFGRVVEGMDIVLRLKKVDQAKRPNSEASKVVKATVLRKRDHEYRPTPVVPEDETVVDIDR